MIRTPVALLGATILLGALVGAASARNFSISNQSLRGAFRAVEFETPSGPTRCPVTMEGSFHSRTAAKVLGTLMGYITSAILGPCSVGVATILRETLPWHIRYSGFEGALPEIRSIIAHIVGAAWRIRESGFGITCLARSSAAEPAVVNFHRSVITHEITEANIGGRIRDGAECGNALGQFTSDSGSVTQVGSTTRLTLTLI